MKVWLVGQEIKKQPIKIVKVCATKEMAKGIIAHHNERWLNMDCDGEYFMFSLPITGLPLLEKRLAARKKK